MLTLCLILQESILVMKTLSLFSLLVLASLSVQAAPAISPKDISEESLREVATDSQRASLDRHNEAVKQAEEAREKAIKESKEITARNDNGMKKTIQRRHLNTMLPPCEREPETPREPADYTIRF